MAENRKRDHFMWLLHVLSPRDITQQLDQGIDHFIIMCEMEMHAYFRLIYILVHVCVS